MASLPSRPYDALYDPTFTVSGARDHYKQQGQSGGFLIEKVPEHANLFSELQHYPTSTFRLKGNDKLPAHVDRSFHPHQPSHSQLQQQSQAAQVNGPQQYKYFRRPNLLPGARMSAALHLAPPKPQTPVQPAPPEPLIKDVATQSDYRETETQTLPWSPDWVLPMDPARLAKQAALSRKFNCQGPELLQLADLKFGDGLPGGLQEVRRLEKMREKRAFEASLPSIDDAERLPERQAMIEAWEAQEWAEREDEIRGVQEERLALLENALMVREEEIEEAHRAQVAERTSNMLSGKASTFAGIHASRIKTIRQLAEKRKKLDAVSKGSSQKPSIIDKYADYGSAVYAPLQREGRFPDVVKPPAAAGALGPQRIGTGAQRLPQPGLSADALVPASLAGLQDLQSSLPARALEPKLQKSKPPAKLNYSQRLEQAIQHDVQTISNLLQTSKQTTGRGVGQVWPYPVDEAAASSIGTGAVKGKTAGQLGSASTRPSGADSKAASAAAAVKIKTAPGERAPTPEAPPPADATGQHAALVLLQRLLRGRAVQNEMYAGKAANLQLIRELRLGLEGTAGSQPRPEARDAFTQELDAVIGAAVCEVCCLLASDDEAAITELLLRVAEKQQQDQQQQLMQQPLSNQAAASTQLEQQQEQPVMQQPSSDQGGADTQQGQEGQQEQQPLYDQGEADTEQQQGLREERRQTRGAVEAIRQEVSAHEVLQQEQSNQQQQLAEQASTSGGPDEHEMLQQSAAGLPGSAAAGAGQKTAGDAYVYDAEEAAAAADLPRSLQPRLVQQDSPQPEQQGPIDAEYQLEQPEGVYQQPERSNSEQLQQHSAGGHISRPDSSNSEASSSQAAAAAAAGEPEPSLAAGVGRAGHLGGLGDSTVNDSAGAVGSVVSLGHGVHADQSGESPHVGGVLGRHDEQQEEDG